MPVGQETLHRVLEAFGARKPVVWNVGITRIVPLEARIVVGQRRRRGRIRAAPDLDLRIAELRRGLRLVEPLQCTVMALVEPPRVLHRDPHAVELLQRDPQRLDCALQHRSECQVELEAFRVQDLSGGFCLAHALVGEADIGPAREAIFHVPRRFAVAQRARAFSLRRNRFASWRTEGSGLARKRRDARPVAGANGVPRREPRAADAGDIGEGQVVARGRGRYSAGRTEHHVGKRTAHGLQHTNAAGLPAPEKA